MKSVFQLKTFDDKEMLIGSSTGFFIDNQGRAVSTYVPFKNASKAVIIDADGKEYQVSYILGANETYDVVKFKVDTKKSVPMPLSQASLPVGSKTWLVGYNQTKSFPVGIIKKAEKFQEYFDYYTLAMQTSDNVIGCPLVNEEGKVIGIMQQSANKKDTIGYAVSAIFADSLHITGLSFNDTSLRSIKIEKELPEELSQALLMLYFASSALDSISYSNLIDRFIKRFPKSAEGYQYRAQLSFNKNDFEAVSKDMEQAINMVEDKDAAHFSYSRFIYQKEILLNQLPYEKWSLDKAMSEAVKAYELNPQPIYRHQQALILFAQKKYEEASSIYNELSTSSLRSADLFVENSKCKEKIGDTIGMVAQLDSAIATFSRPYVRQAAPYLLHRAQVLMGLNEYRKAVFDLNDYESLMKTQVTAQFYYLRFQAELSGKMYQQALDDINKAIEMQEKNDLFYSEKASLLLRVGFLDETITTAEKLIELVPNQSDGYLFLGIAQCMKDNKKEGLENLKKAEQMGDSQATDMIEKFK